MTTQGNAQGDGWAAHDHATLTYCAIVRLRASYPCQDRPVIAEALVGKTPMRQGELPDAVPVHLYVVAMGAALLVPEAGVSIFPWKEPKEQIPLAARQIQSFLRAYRPASRAVALRQGGSSGQFGDSRARPYFQLSHNVRPLFPINRSERRKRH
jgi:hypothetical protein